MTFELRHTPFHSLEFVVRLIRRLIRSGRLFCLLVICLFVLLVPLAVFLIVRGSFSSSMVWHIGTVDQAIRSRGKVVGVSCYIVFGGFIRWHVIFC